MNSITDVRCTAPRRLIDRPRHTRPIYGRREHSPWRLGFAAVALYALLYALSSRAEIVPARGAVDGRIRVAAYNSEQVYKLRGYVGYQIDLEFESGEGL